MLFLRHLRRSAATTAATTAHSAVRRQPKFPTPISKTHKTVTIPLFPHSMHFTTHALSPLPKTTKTSFFRRIGFFAVGSGFLLATLLYRRSGNFMDEAEARLWLRFGAFSCIIDRLIDELEARWPPPCRELRELVEEGNFSLAEQRFKETIGDYEFILAELEEAVALFGDGADERSKEVLKKVRGLAVKVEGMRDELMEWYREMVESNWVMRDWFEETENDGENKI